MGSDTVKENHIGSAVSEILRYRHADRDPVTFIGGSVDLTGIVTQSLRSDLS